MSTPRPGPVYIPPRCILPSRIEIINQPDNLRYLADEAIDLSGIVVKAFKANGEPVGFLPDGIVPTEELYCDPDTAVGTDIWTDGDGINALYIEVSTKIKDADPGNFYSTNQWAYIKQALGQNEQSEPCTIGFSRRRDQTYSFPKMFLTRYNNELYAMRIDGDSDFNLCVFRNGAWVNSGSTSYHTTLNQWTEAAWGDVITDVPVSTKNPLEAGEMRSVVDGNVAVLWDYSGKTYTDTFHITTR